MRKKRRLLIAALIIFGLCVCALTAVMIVNAVVIHQAEHYIFDIDELDSLDHADCVLVLGARVYDNESLSPILKDRVDCALAIYNAGKTDKLLFSGDHGQKDYDEVNAMMDYAVEKGVPKEDIFLDHAGFSTYESVYRARDVFLVSDVIIVTQKFHLSRAVYNAQALGLNVSGVNSDPRVYANAKFDALRETLARVKDFFYVNIFVPEPKYLGETIPIFGSSDETHDKN